MSHSDDTAGTDDFPFQTPTTGETTRQERWSRTLDRTVLAPMRIILSDWRGKVGVVILTAYLLMGIVGPYLIAPPETDTANMLVGPFQTWEYPLGTDSSGRSLLADVVHATPPMLKMVFAGGVFAVTVGSIVGMVAGYKGGRIDQALMVVTDTLMAIPGLPLVIVLAFLFEPRNPYVVGIILAIPAWSVLARSIRSQMLPLRNVEYVEANRLMGISTWKIILKDVAPNLMPYILVSFVSASRGIVFDSIALYFLGVLPTTDPNWGVTMDTAYSSGGALYSWGAAHWLLAPMFAVVFLSLGLILIAQAADKLFNPRIRARHQKTTASEGEGDDGDHEPSAPPEGAVR
ncbi:ABC transporter permease [Natronobacterium texcoconense]|uniref:Peptide/nickel transport system permease protein n=1 Tax=Natronobacterium texcoconense TaxID=1095778 RepID=A0A1H1FUF0_NATTX|nr:ABC transporter permease [Natronobacterium texcoconense]SDR04378.1 peptide/nickel transport system permease protein [Natronobacterium texcoconense]